MSTQFVNVYSLSQIVRRVINGTELEKVYALTGFKLVDHDAIKGRGVALITLLLRWLVRWSRISLHYALCVSKNNCWRHSDVGEGLCEAVCEAV